MIPSVRHETVGPPGSRRRIRIAHLSDLHLWFSDRKLRPIEQLIESWQPDVLALTGDYADTRFGRRVAVDWIRRIASAYPVCWVAGNHDRWWGRHFLQTLETLLLPHAIDQRDAWITGKSGCRCRFTTLERLAEPTPADPDFTPTVVLLHDPGLILPEKLRVVRNCLLLAGHLHGGQITLWRDRQGHPQPAASWYQWLGDRSMIDMATVIVSRGLGDTLPVRFRAPKEIVIVDFGV